MSTAYNKASSNDTSQPEDALIPELPPRISTEVQRSPPPYVTNQNLFSVLVKNKRQITSLTAGINIHIFTICNFVLVALVLNSVVIVLFALYLCFCFALNGFCTCCIYVRIFFIRSIR